MDFDCSWRAALTCSAVMRPMVRTWREKARSRASLDMGQPRRLHTLPDEPHVYRMYSVCRGRGESRRPPIWDWAKTLLLHLPDLHAGQVGVASGGAEFDDAIVRHRDGPGSQLVPVAGRAADVALLHFTSVQKDVEDLAVVVLPDVQVHLVGSGRHLVALDHRAPGGERGRPDHRRARVVGRRIEGHVLAL